MDAFVAAGIEPPLFSKAQIESGMPFVMPDLSNVNG